MPFIKTPERKKKILVVDDENGIRELLSACLQHGGYETLTAVDGLDGLGKAAKFLPDLILLDVLMPGMDGWQMLTRLRADENTKNIPVVILTAKGDTEAVLKSERERAADFFIKPIDEKELLTFIQRYIH